MVTSETKIKIKQYFYPCVLISLILFTVVAVIYSFINYDDYQHMTSEISNNWANNLIIDAEIHTEKCPTGFEPAFEYDWLGTHWGCYCGFSNRDYMSKYGIAK